MLHNRNLYNIVPQQKNTQKNQPSKDQWTDIIWLKIQLWGKSALIFTNIPLVLAKKKCASLFMGHRVNIYVFWIKVKFARIALPPYLYYLLDVSVSKKSVKIFI